MSTDWEQVGLRAVFDTSDFDEGMRRFAAGVRRTETQARSFERTFTLIGKVAGAALGTTTGSPLGTFVGGLLGGAVGRGLGQYIDRMRAAQTETDKFIKKWQTAGTVVGSIIGTIMIPVIGLGSAIGALFGRVIGGAIARFIVWMRNLGATISSAFRNAGETIKNIVRLIREGLSNALSFLVDVGREVINVLGRVARAIADIGQQALMTAGRAYELEITAQVIGQSFGYTREEIDAAISSVQEAGVAYGTAAEFVAQLTRYNVDLAGSFDLVRIAQGAAIFSGRSSTEVVHQMALAIANLNTYQLRRMGITIPRLTDAYQRYANELGVATEALTAMQQRQAIVNAILRENQALLALYENVMESPTKAWRTFTSRMIPDLLRALGAPFLQAFKNVVDGLNDLAEAFRLAVSEGGRLFPIMVQLGAIGSLITDALGKLAGRLSSWLRDENERLNRDLVDVLTSIARAGVKIATTLMHGIAAGMRALTRFITGAGGEIAIRLAEGLSHAATRVSEVLSDISANILGAIADTASAAFRGGAEIAVQLARGLTQGAAAAIGAAVRYIGQLLSFWLAPGSAPRVAPDIDQWGAAAMGEFLHAMTLADFGVLEALQGPLQQVLTGPAFKQISVFIARALSGAGMPGASFFEDLAHRAGAFGQEIAELARLEIELALATDAVTAAELRLEQARRRTEQLQGDILRQTIEYNRMVRGGADRRTLDAQLARINASERQLDLAEEQQAAAEQELRDAQDTEESLRDRVRLQEKLVDQLIRLFVEAREAREARAAGGGGDEGIMEDLIGTLPDASDFDLSNALEAALSDATKLISARAREVFQPLVDTWNNTVRPAISDLHKAFSGLMTRLRQELEPVHQAWVDFKRFLEAFGEWLMGPFTDTILEFARNPLQTLLDRLLTALSAFGQLIMGFAGFQMPVPLPDASSGGGSGGFSDDSDSPGPQRVIRAIPFMAGAGGGRSVNLSFGDVYNQTPFDVAMMRQFIIRTVREQIREA